MNNLVYFEYLLAAALVPLIVVPPCLEMMNLNWTYPVSFQILVTNLLLLWLKLTLERIHFSTNNMQPTKIFRKKTENEQTNSSQHSKVSLALLRASHQSAERTRNLLLSKRLILSSGPRSRNASRQPLNSTTGMTSTLSNDSLHASETKLPEQSTTSPSPLTTPSLRPSPPSKRSTSTLPELNSSKPPSNSPTENPTNPSFNGTPVVENYLYELTLQSLILKFLMILRNDSSWASAIGTSPPKSRSPTTTTPGNTPTSSIEHRKYMVTPSSSTLPTPTNLFPPTESTALNCPACNYLRDKSLQQYNQLINEEEQTGFDPLDVITVEKWGTLLTDVLLNKEVSPEQDQNPLYPPERTTVMLPQSSNEIRKTDITTLESPEEIPLTRVIPEDSLLDSEEKENSTDLTDQESML